MCVCVCVRACVCTVDCHMNMHNVVSKVIKAKSFGVYSVFARLK